MKGSRVMQSPPADYGLHKTLDLSKNIRLAVLMNLVGLVLFFAFGWLMLIVARAIRPEAAFGNIELTLNLVDLVPALGLLVGFLGLAFLMLIFHEGVHGLFFWAFTGARPKFGFKGVYAYTAAPDWYLSRLPYVVVALAPLVILTALGVAALWAVPASWILPLLLLVTLNASGAIGDILISFWTLWLPKDALIQDFGDGVSVYVRP